MGHFPLSVTEAGEATGHIGLSLRVNRSEPQPARSHIHSPGMSEQNCHGQTALTLTVVINSDENRWEGSHACLGDLGPAAAS